MTTPRHSAWSSSRPQVLPQELGRWRLRRLVEAGFPPDLADEVASDERFDLHALLVLVDRGCPPELAVRITAPLPTERFP